jgi:hypothetical protein
VTLGENKLYVHRETVVSHATSSNSEAGSRDPSKAWTSDDPRKCCEHYRLRLDCLEAASENESGERQMSIVTIEGKVADLISDVAGRLSVCEQSLDRLRSTLRMPVECPLNQPKSLDGIISYLTRKHG